MDFILVDSSLLIPMFKKYHHNQLATVEAVSIY